MSLIAKVPSYKEAKYVATNRDEILALEKRVTNWIRKIREVSGRLDVLDSIGL